MIIAAPPICPSPTLNDLKYGICNSALADWLAAHGAPEWIITAEIAAAFIGLAFTFLIVCLIARGWNDPRS